MSLVPTVELAEAILAEWTERPGLLAAFLAGSVAKGKAKEGSDIDAVLVYEHVPRAARETHARQDIIVELFIHDQDTLGYFWQADRRSGRANLARMVAGGLPLAGDPVVIELLKDQAQALLDVGPLPLMPEELAARRYIISDLAGDLGPQRSYGQRLAVGCRLHAELADFHLRATGRWSGNGKGLAKALVRSDPEAADRFEQAFRLLFAEDDPSAVQDLVDFCLEPHGGRLIAGARRTAPPEWRIMDD